MAVDRTASHPGPVEAASPAESAPLAGSAEERLDRVAHTLRAVSASRCQTPEMLTGLSLHDIGAYDAEQRALVESRLLLGSGVGVRHIVPESTAARAGLRPGDVITQVNGVDLASFETGLIGARASYDRTASFERLLDAALVVGPATLTLRRGGSEQTMTLTGIPGCGGKPVLYDRGGLNAWSDGKAVAVTTAMMRFAKTDAELAFVVAHEMSHNVLGHADKLRGKSMLLASFGIGSGKIKRSEIEADQMAVELMIAAGYPVEGATSLLRRASP
uniref:M48 family metallopeptidase n=1 Tax=Novosphingobium sp. TaxID=1874826 RepID=UPI00260D4479